MALVDDGTAAWLVVEAASAAPLADVPRADAVLEAGRRSRTARRTSPCSAALARPRRARARTGRRSSGATRGRPAPPAAITRAEAPLPPRCATCRCGSRSCRATALADARRRRRAPGAVALAGVDALEALRIAAWRPRAAREVDARSIPHELDWLRSAVHLDKGCYRGQETVAKVHNLGRPPRRLVQLDLDGSESVLPEPGSVVLAGDAEVGVVTSSARHHEDGPIALAVVKRSVAEDAPLVVRTRGRRRRRGAARRRAVGRRTRGRRAAPARGSAPSSGTDRARSGRAGSRFAATYAPRVALRRAVESVPAAAQLAIAATASYSFAHFVRRPPGAAARDHGVPQQPRLRPRRPPEAGARDGARAVDRRRARGGDAPARRARASGRSCVALFATLLIARLLNAAPAGRGRRDRAVGDRAADPAARRRQLGEEHRRVHRRRGRAARDRARAARSAPRRAARRRAGVRRASGAGSTTPRGRSGRRTGRPPPPRSRSCATCSPRSWTGRRRSTPRSRSRGSPRSSGAGCPSCWRSAGCSTGSSSRCGRCAPSRGGRRR